EDAQRLHGQTYLLSEFLAKYAPHYPARELAGQKAVVQMHCHHRAIMKVEAEQQLMKKLGLEVQTPESGCCGMAGAFGFEKGEHYDVSIKCGERHLLPAVRQTNEETLVIADGFSCHEQIVQQTDKKPMHIAEVLHLAMTKGTPRPPESPESSTPESQEETDATEHDRGEHKHLLKPAERVVTAAVLAGMTGAYLLGRNKKQDEEH
ncbi:MAG TPA: (Fe-S)-binding protein, partial [Verrucomicrobiae bacterium]|nr:(Fe-S)-binding protein [Verrucomicrobiae bacterium]